MMTRARLTISTVIIAGIILIVFAFSVPRTRDVTPESSLSTESTSTPVVIVRDSYRKGVHTITGTLEALDACTTVEASATPVGDEPATPTAIALALTTVESTGVCLELPTLIEFKTTVEAPADLPINVTVNGVAVTATPS